LDVVDLLLHLGRAVGRLLTARRQQGQNQGEHGDRPNRAHGMNSLVEPGDYFRIASFAFNSVTFLNTSSGSARALASHAGQQMNTVSPLTNSLRGTPIVPSRLPANTGQKRWLRARARSSGSRRARAAAASASSSAGVEGRIAEAAGPAGLVPPPR